MNYQLSDYDVMSINGTLRILDPQLQRFYLEKVPSQGLLVLCVRIHPRHLWQLELIIDEIRTRMGKNIYQVEYDLTACNPQAIIKIPVHNLGRVHQEIAAIIEYLETPLIEKDMRRQWERESNKWHIPHWIPSISTTAIDLMSQLSRKLLSQSTLLIGQYDLYVIDGTFILNNSEHVEITCATYTLDNTPLKFKVQIPGLDISLPTVGLKDSAVFLHTDTYGDYYLTEDQVNKLVHDIDKMDLTTLASALSVLYMDHVDNKVAFNEDLVSNSKS